MKKRTANEEKLSNVVNNFIDQSGLRNKFQEQEILHNFKNIMGPFLMKKVKKLKKLNMNIEKIKVKNKKDFCPRNQAFEIDDRTFKNQQILKLIKCGDGTLIQRKRYSNKAENDGFRNFI